MIQQIKYKRFFIALLLITLAGCSNRGVYTPQGERPIDVWSSFKAGDVRLTCVFACVSSYVDSKRELRSYYNKEQWRKLVNTVIKVGQKKDLTYFLLGRAAEGEGFIFAAKTYYKLALYTTFKCGSSLNCMGIHVPNEATTRLKHINKFYDKNGRLKPGETSKVMPHPQADSTYFYNLGIKHKNAKHHSAYNFVQAHMYFNLAASKGHVKARKARDEIAKKMTFVQIERAQDLALEFNERN